MSHQSQNLFATSGGDGGGGSEKVRRNDPRGYGGLVRSIRANETRTSHLLDELLPVSAYDGPLVYLLLLHEGIAEVVLQHL